MAHRQWWVDAHLEASDSRTDFRVVPTESRPQSATAHSRAVTTNVKKTDYQYIKK